jgi:hypothetical protein
MGGVDWAQGTIIDVNLCTSGANWGNNFLPCTSFEIEKAAMQPFFSTLCSLTTFPQIMHCASYATGPAQCQLESSMWGRVIAHTPTALPPFP